MIEVETPDGSVIEFPEGTPDSTIIKVMRDSFGAPKSQSPSLAETAGTALAAVGTGAGRVAANVLGLPGMVGDLIQSTRPEGYSQWNGMDIIGRGLSALPNPQEMQTALFENTGTPEFKPQSALGKLAMETGVGAATGMGLPIGMGVGAAAKYGAMAGAGGEVAGQATEGTSIEPYARIAGSMAAPMAGTALANYGKNMYQGIRGTRPTTGAVDEKILTSLAGEGQTPQQMQAVLANSGNTGATLANRNASLGSETTRAAQQTPMAASIARQSAARDMKDSFARIRTKLANVLPAAKGDLTSTKKEILETMGTQAAPLYDRFKQTAAGKGFTESAPRNAIQRLARTNPDVLRKVLENAVRVDNPITGIKFTETGLDLRSATLADLTKVMDGIDSVIYGADDFAKSFQTNTGKPNQQAQVLLDIRSKLNGFVRSKSPDFAAANDIYSSGHRMRKAAQEGFEALSESRGLGEARDFFQGLSVGEKEAFRSGLASKLINNFDTGAMTPNQIEKLTEKVVPFVGKGNAERIKAIMNNERIVQEATRRLQSVMPQAKGFGDDAASEMSRVAGGVVASPKGTMISKGLEMSNRVFTGRGPEYFDRLNVDLVKATTTSDPKEASKILQGIIRRQAEAVKKAKEISTAKYTGALIGAGQPSEP
ncbi:hypothetical protein UFOVP826_49 [uncultured Caudovirales phage]|uniref:Uncharacterized protein n=1 Tax=uncultured Caudovirales phage TaxID=2100421 RepID=A0A6J5P571_9CAUD|nr:hypothetical protein UFOVP826_49 [uncultured Caudovirales phage]